MQMRTISVLEIVLTDRCIFPVMPRSIAVRASGRCTWPPRTGDTKQQFVEVGPIALRRHDRPRRFRFDGQIDAAFHWLAASAEMLAVAGRRWTAFLRSALRPDRWR